MSVVVFTKNGKPHGVIDEIQVHKDYRRQGYATRLVANAKRALKLESLVMSNHMTRNGASFRRAIEPDWKGKRVGPSDRWDDASLYLTPEQAKARKAEELSA
jgi:ribosomal protein S18 acetylase RimI-like enzyme